MPRIMESVSTVNSLIRTLLALIVVGAASVAGWFGYTNYNANEMAFEQATQQLEDVQRKLVSAHADLESTRTELQQSLRDIDALQQTVAEQTEKIEQLDTAMRLLKVNRRVARLTVISQQDDPESGQLISEIEFVELDPGGEPFDAPRRFRIEGDLVYIDNWIVKFDDKYVEMADIDRSTSLVLFRRIYGEFQKPRDGFLLDEVGSRPRAYGRSAMGEFEKQIWDDFWNIASDEQKARDLGIRAAHGDAPFIKVKPGTSYLIQLRASDGLSIVPENRSPVIEPRS